MSKLKSINTAEYLKGSSNPLPPGFTANFNVSIEYIRGVSKSRIIDQDANEGVPYNKATFGKEISVKTLIDRMHPQKKSFYKKMFDEFLKDTKGYKIVITNTYRTISNSYRLFNTGQTTAKPGRSAHIYGLAMDLNIFGDDGFSARMSDPSYKWLSTPLIDLANKNGIVWGGTFPSFYDPVHFGFDGQYNTNQVVLDLEKKYKISIKNDEAKIKFKESKNKFSYDGRKINIKFR